MQDKSQYGVPRTAYMLLKNIIVDASYRYNELCKPKHRMRIGHYSNNHKLYIEAGLYPKKYKRNLRKKESELLLPFLRKFNYEPTWTYKPELDKLNYTTGEWSGLLGSVI